MEHIKVRKVKGAICPQCSEEGYFQLEEGITWFYCYVCGYKVHAKHYRDKLDEKKENT
jgi:uncharacterized metal-binding protein (TIGR02443 family)